MKLDKDFWDTKYQNQNTGWDIGYISTPLKEYIDQLTDKNIRILIPGGGNSYEAEYLHNLGFKNVYIVDIAKTPLKNIKKRVPSFLDSNLIYNDFFKLDMQFDLIIEQTFFCALNPDLRSKYALKMHDLLATNGKLVGLLFNFPLDSDSPPFGGSKKEYLNYFQDGFDIQIMETAHNSIPNRASKELFIKLVKKK